MREMTSYSKGVGSLESCIRMCVFYCANAPVFNRPDALPFGDERMKGALKYLGRYQDRPRRNRPPCPGRRIFLISLGLLLWYEVEL